MQLRTYNGHQLRADAGRNPAFAQYGARALSEPATGETYHFEVGGAFYSPTPTLFITSEGLGIPGDEIDFVKEFDLENQTFKQLRLVLRPARKHKLRYEFVPIRYEKEATITRSIVFNGQRFNVSLPVLAELVERDAFHLRVRLRLPGPRLLRAGARPEIHGRRSGPDECAHRPRVRPCRRQSRPSAAPAVTTSCRIFPSPGFTLFKLPSSFDED